MVLQLCNSRLCRPYTDIVVRVNLPQALQFSLSGNELTFERGGGLDHGFALFLDVEGRVLAGELAEVLFGRLQVLLYGI